jgi:kynureninase
MKSVENFRKHFLIPQKEGKDKLYFCGNSLGLQPKSVRNSINQELDDWANLGVEGHFNAKKPWLYYHHQFAKPLAKLTGSTETEVVAMNGLSVNLHLLLASFYQPKKDKRKILIESNVFPSDYQIVASQMKFHGINPHENIIELTSLPNEHTLRTEIIIEAIRKHKNSLALVFLGGVNYYTGQVLDMKNIALECKKSNILLGLDLAHAIGNVPLRLHDWGVDFASWCSYKYLNSGPGGVSGIFIHEKNINNPDLKRLEAWWGSNESTRFQMKKNFEPMIGAAAWQLSNAPILNMAAHKAALDIFEMADFDELRLKSLQMTEFLIKGLKEYKNIEIITPLNDNERGCQISMFVKNEGRKLFHFLERENIVADWREPNVIRIAPVPLYNTMEEIEQFLHTVKRFYN